MSRKGSSKRHSKSAGPGQLSIYPREPALSAKGTAGIIASDLLEKARHPSEEVQALPASIPAPSFSDPPALPLPLSPTAAS